MTSLQDRIQRVIRQDVKSMHGYAVQPRAGFIRVDVTENPFRLPTALRHANSANAWPRWR